MFESFGTASLLSLARLIVWNTICFTICCFNEFKISTPLPQGSSWSRRSCTVSALLKKLWYPLAFYRKFLKPSSILQCIEWFRKCLSVYFQKKNARYCLMQLRHSTPFLAISPFNLEASVPLFEPCILRVGTKLQELHVVSKNGNSKKQFDDVWVSIDVWQNGLRTKHNCGIAAPVSYADV